MARSNGMIYRRLLLLLAALALTTAACGSSGPAANEVANSLRGQVQNLTKSTAVRGDRMWQAEAVRRFYEARQFKPAWRGDRTTQTVAAIRAIEQDGLTPSDYHLAALDRLIKEREKATTPALEADVDILVTDAILAMIDHVRYGRVRPVSLNPAWNADPREDAPPLEKEAERIASANSVSDAIAGVRPNHFIYRGLVGALAKLREISAKGGWPTVTRGKSIKPGATDPRIPAVRARLAVSGEAGAPSQSTAYDSGLRKSVELFQARHRLEPNGIIDKDTIDAMNVSSTQRAGQVRVNLERARWVLGGLGDEFLLVNLPAYKAYLIRGGRNDWEARTQIGEEGWKTPSFSATMRTIVFNPDWTVPGTIIAEELAGEVRKDGAYLAKKGLVVLDKDGQEVDPSSVDWGNAASGDFPYTLRQPPGTDNALGRVKFLFPNKYSIYLHDTPSRTNFEAEKRTFSHGCIRLEKPLELATLLLAGQWDRGKIDQAIASGTTENVELTHPLPVLIVYWTVSVGASGEIRYMRDVYDQDQKVFAALNRGR
ncbi:MAG TPA: L,D-transpeptidase family protein [Candidatus Eisenbacteria bacterium]|nr:L,D-transpeptidase family protein [Candidatus Eisenbacteria bacterium]